MASVPDDNQLTDIAGLVSTLKIANQNASLLITTLSDCLSGQSADQSSLGLVYSVTAGTSGCTLISTSASYLVSVSVTDESTGTTGFLYDAASVANAGSSNAFAVIPSSGYIVYNWPISQGLVVKPSSQGSHTVSVSYF